MPVNLGTELGRRLAVLKFQGIEPQQKIFGLFVAGMRFEVSRHNFACTVFFLELQVDLRHTPQRHAVDGAHRAGNFGQVLQRLVPVFAFGADFGNTHKRAHAVFFLEVTLLYRLFQHGERDVFGDLFFREQHAFAVKRKGFLRIAPQRAVEEFQCRGLFALFEAEQALFGEGARAAAAAAHD